MLVVLLAAKSRKMGASLDGDFHPNALCGVQVWCKSSRSMKLHEARRSYLYADVIVQMMNVHPVEGSLRHFKNSGSS